MPSSAWWRRDRRRTLIQSMVDAAMPPEVGVPSSEFSVIVVDGEESVKPVKLAGFHVSK